MTDEGAGAAEQVELATMVGGFQDAVARYHRDRMSTEGQAGYVPLFEALAWAVSIDERLEFPEQPELRGLRFARNRVHHQWADALHLDTRGFQFPVKFPIGFYEWRWRAELPLPENPKHRGGEEVYREHLAGVPARLTIDTVEGCFAQYQRERGS